MRFRSLFVAVLAAGLLGSAGVPAAAASTAPRAIPATAAPAGWTADRVRFEPLEADRPVGVVGLGAYRGALEVGRTGAGLAVVDDLSLEDYLLGISEVPTSWPAEAQRAQAVAARTYAAHEIGRAAGARSGGRTAGAPLEADLCATDACQVYVGLAKERRPGSERWADAVRATAGQALLFRGAPILAKYSSTNGGRSIAGGRPYLRAIDDPDDAASPYHRWHVEIPLSEIGAIVGAPGEVVGTRRTGDLIEVAWERRPAPQSSAEPEGAEPEPEPEPTPAPPPEDASGVVTLPAAELRARLNQRPAPDGLPLTLPSVRFEVGGDPARGVAVFDGRGWGHAIGLSQFGALGKALRGLRHPEILAAYYGGLRPTKAPNLPARVRVLVAERPSVELAAEGRFRVLDSGGQVLAVAGAGRWRVVPGPKGAVRVVPPVDQAGSPQLSGVVAEPAVPAPGEPVDLRFHLSAPALVRVSVRQGSGPEIVVSSGVVEAGEALRAVPALGRTGSYVVTVHADAGGGRSSSTPVGVRVGRATRPSVSASVAAGLPPTAARGPLLTATGWPRRGPTALASLLLTLLLSVAWAHRRPLQDEARLEFVALRGRRGA